MQTTQSTGDTEREVLALAEQVADLLARMESLAPGSTRAHGGTITGLGVEIRQTAGNWNARSAR